MMQHCPVPISSGGMQRRTLLQLGLGATALLAIAGGGLALMKPGLAQGRMTAATRPVFHAVARAVLDGSLPADAARREATLVAHLARLDDTLAGFPPHVQSELSQLLALLASAPGRATLAGLHADWPVRCLIRKCEWLSNRVSCTASTTTRTWTAVLKPLMGQQFYRRASDVPSTVC